MWDGAAVSATFGYPGGQMRDEIWGVIQAFPGGIWGILILCAAYLAGWYFTGWYFKREQ
jgi:hypothetical protein